jgi:hypothetical protein
MKNKLFKNFTITLFIGFLFSATSLAQETTVDDYRMKFDFNTFKQADNSRLLEVSFIGTNKKDRKDKAPVFEADIEFYNFLNEQEVKLGVAKTDKEGLAQLTLEENQSYLVDEEGYINLKAVFEGTGELDSEEEEIAVKDLYFELDLEEIDSVKTVLLQVYTLDSIKSKVPVEEIDVIFSVGGMLSKMPIEEASVENGEYEFEFPEGIPGDKDGNIDVFVSLEDHDDFANVIQKKTVNWGVLNKIIETESNTLWSEVAPIWMYVVLTILLVGVWSNYIYSFINLLKIKKEGKELESKNKELS